LTETPQTPPPKPAAAAAPAGRTSDEIRRDALIAGPAERLGDAIYSAKEFVGEITLIVDPDRIVDVCRELKADGWNYLVDLAGVDYSTYPGHTGLRFGVSYTLYSFAKNQRLRVRTLTDAKLPSVSAVWKTANWHEREAYDMFGIFFEGHPNLERILMWEGFNGYPLRKDFPIRGIDTGARIYPEVFPEGGGPKAGSTGKDVKDVNIFKGEWTQYGMSPVAQIPVAKPAAPAPKAIAAPAAETAAATSEGDVE
jgi:NADH-quinone oxidoreductase subunit C